MIDGEALDSWKGRGGMIVFEENDRGELIGHLPITRILEITDPVAEPPWHDGQDVTRDGVMAAIKEARLEPRPYSVDLMTVNRDDWTARRHEERIAWLVVNHPVEPISVEIDGFGDVGVDDGLHRLYASVIRGKQRVLVQLGGFIDDAPLVLGVFCRFRPHMAGDEGLSGASSSLPETRLL